MMASMTDELNTPDRSEVMRKLRETALERAAVLRDLADRLQGPFGDLHYIRDEAAAHLRQLAGE
jgi:hypothetical protein